MKTAQSNTSKISRAQHLSVLFLHQFQCPICTYSHGQITYGKKPGLSPQGSLCCVDSSGAICVSFAFGNVIYTTPRVNGISWSCTTLWPPVHESLSSKTYKETSTVIPVFILFPWLPGGTRCGQMADNRVEVQRIQGNICNPNQ